MKKIYLAYGVALVSLAACSGNKAKNEACNGTCEKSDSTEEVVYEGTLPAADVEGVRYTLSLDYSDDTPDKGDYDLTEVYISQTNPATFKSEGDFTVLTGTPQDSTQRYLRLVPKVEAGARPDTLYMVVTSDSTLTLTGPDRTVTRVDGMNYDLVKK